MMMTTMGVGIGMVGAPVGMEVHGPAWSPDPVIRLAVRWCWPFYR